MLLDTVHPVWFRLTILLLLSQAAVFHGAAAEANVAVAAPAAWVTPQTFQRLPPGMRFEPGEHQRWLLYDRQINAANNENFTRAVRQMITFSGVQSGANLTVDFNPSYQALTFHWVRIWRGTNVLDRLDTGKIRVMNQEPELDQFLVVGEQSAVLVLEDVRVGDIIDYAYSIRGANPILGGKFSGSAPVRLRDPAERLAVRLVWPSSRRLFARNHGGSAKLTAVPKNQTTEYLWEGKKVPGVHLEDSVPEWYEPEPWIQFSEFQTWAEVNQWALKLFTNSASLSPELTQKIMEWRRIAVREEQVATILRFLQNEVRYFGIEIGENSHQPSSPSVVFARRFGDCKDKTLLFVTVLRTLGIEAWPVLVNTRSGRGIEQWQPSPLAFNHVIAQVRLDRRTFWLDPTDSFQRGTLATAVPPEYERGLVVQPQAAGLSTIPRETEPPPTTVTEYFQLRGRMQPADFTVVTVAQGTDAERLRTMLAATKREQVEKDYLHFYSGVYPGIRKSQPIAVADDERQNRIEITEKYTVENIWIRSEQDGRFRCEFFPRSIAALLRKPVDTARTMPLAVRFPEHYILRTEVTAPEIWQSNLRDKTISDPAFFFRVNVRNRGTRLTFEYEYRALADFVAPERTAEYLRRLSDASQSLGHSLSW